MAAPVPQVSGTMFFSDQNSGAGTSETHWLTSSSIALPAALGQLKLLAVARAQLLGNNVNVSYLRVHDTATYGSSQIYTGLLPKPVNPAKPQGDTTYNPQLPAAYAQSVGVTPPPASIPASASYVSSLPDVPWTAVLIRLEAGAPFNSRRSLYLRHIPDFTTDDFSIVTDPTRLAAFKKYQAALTSDSLWGMRVLDKAQPKTKITMIANNAAGANTPANVSITCPGATFVVGQMVRVSGVKYQGPPAEASALINSVWQVATVSTDGSTITLVGQVGNINWQLGGTVQIRSYVILPYTAVNQVRLTTRHPGQQFASFHGRRKRRKTAH
jgi:hypothetical protein